MNKKILTPEPDEEEQGGHVGEWSVKVKITEAHESPPPEEEEEPRRRRPGPKSRMRPVTPQQETKSEELAEEGPRRRPGPKSRMRSLTPQQKVLPELNSKRSMRRGRESPEDRTSPANEENSDEDTRLPTPQPRMSDSEE